MPTVKQIRYEPANDLYKVLGVSPSATVDDINRAYRNRAKEVHPDLNPERAEWANGQFQRLNMAHDVLINATQRSDYDQKRRLYLDSTNTGGRGSPLAQASRAAWGRSHRKRAQWYWLFQGSLGLVCIGSVFLLFHAGPSSDEAAPPPSDNQVVTTAAPLLVPPESSVPCTDPNVMITEPADGTTVDAPFSIKGTAAGRNFVGYKLDIFQLDQFQPDQGDWTTMIASSVRVNSGALIEDSNLNTWQNNLNLFADTSGIYRVRLTVDYAAGSSSFTSSCVASFHVANPPIATPQNASQ